MKSNCSKIAAGALLLFSCAVQGGAAAAPDEEPPSINSRRNLRGEASNYRAYKGRRCSGINGDEEIEVIRGISRKFCKRECNLSKFCYGFEISRSGTCELWDVQIDEGDLKTDDERECQIKIGGPDVGMLVPPEIPPDTYFDRNENRGCSTIDGDKGSRETGQFDLFKNVSPSECEDLCLLSVNSCYGYEFTARKGQSNGKCEVWKDPISSDLKFVDGVDCYVLDDSSRTSRDTSAGNVDNKWNFDARELGSVVDDNGSVWSRTESFPRQMWYEQSTRDEPATKWKQVDVDANVVYLEGRDIGNEGVTVEMDLTNQRVWRCSANGSCRKVASIIKVTAIGEEPNNRVCSSDKQVQIYKIRTNGIYDGQVTEGAYQITLNGARYFPKDSSDCDQDPTGYCIWPESRGKYIGDKAEWKIMGDSDRSTLTVGFREHVRVTNTESEVDVVQVTLANGDWYIDTCETYDVRVAVDVGVSSPKTSKCFNLSPTLFDVLDKAGTVVNDCDDWTQPVERFIWYVEVKPAPLKRKRAFRVFNAH